MQISCIRYGTENYDQKVGGDQYIAGPPNQKVGGGLVSPGPYGCCAYALLTKSVWQQSATIGKFARAAPLKITTGGAEGGLFIIKSKFAEGPNWGK